jgi:ribosomal protein S11
MKKKKPNNLYIKFWRNNIFLNLSTFNGKLLFKCSCGYIKGDQKKNLVWALIYLIKILKVKAKLHGNNSINLILEGAYNKTRVKLIYNQLLKWDFVVVYFRIVDKIPHNGCRSKVKKTKLVKRFYLG